MSNQHKDVGYSVFSNMVVDRTTKPIINVKISRDEWNTFKHQYLFDCIRGLTLGQSFCSRYGITDNLLLYVLKTEDAVDHYVDIHYIEKDL